MKKHLFAKLPLDGGICETLASHAEALFYMYRQNGEINIDTREVKKLYEY